MKRPSLLIFDLDGTLTEPVLDFDRIRGEIGLAPGPILETLAELDPAARARGHSILSRHEAAAAESAVARSGAREALDWLRGRHHKLAILTRNNRLSALRTLARLQIRVDGLVTRDDAPIKPSPDGILKAARDLGVDPCEGWMIGDYLFDIQAGRAAGCRTILLAADKTPPYADLADHVIGGLAELVLLLDT